MRKFRAELHLHTLLSPCAEIEMIPPLIVQEALERGANLIAVTDHNTSRNAQAVIEAAEGSGLAVLPGMELQTREEVHLLCLFDTLEQVQAWQARVDEKLPDLLNNPERLGEQFVVDATGDFIAREDRLLLTSASMTFEEAVAGVEELGGLPIPAHVDRQANGLISVLGFVPETVRLAALEISRRLRPEQALEKIPQIRGRTLLQGGDAHRLNEILVANEFLMEDPTVDEIRMALAAAGGRKFRVWSREELARTST
jgi:PHP family Zn ribbon phosphoesterase